MSIKQNGGVFGRNPTFNDVTIEGQLTFDGDIDINSDLTVDGNIDVTGNASIGTVSSPKTLTVGGTGLRVQSTASADFYSAGQDAIVGNNGTSNFKFWNNGVESIRIDSSSNVKVLAGNLVIGTSGKGIDFSATSGTGTSELLDDYEEGTWTVTVATGSLTGTTTAKYLKCGNSVTVWVGAIAFSDITSAEIIIIGGLPFTATQGGQGSLICSYMGAVSPDTVNLTGTAAKFYVSSTSGAFSAVQHSAFNSTANQLYFTVTYQST